MEQLCILLVLLSVSWAVWTPYATGHSRVPYLRLRLREIQRLLAAWRKSLALSIAMLTCWWLADSGNVELNTRQRRLKMMPFRFT